MTRARDDLALVQPLRFPITQQPKQGDAHVYGGRSRFMSEKVLKTLDSVSFQGSNLGEASLAETGQSAYVVTRALAAGVRYRPEGLMNFSVKRSLSPIAAYFARSVSPSA